MGNTGNGDGDGATKYFVQKPPKEPLDWTRIRLCMHPTHTYFLGARRRGSSISGNAYWLYVGSRAGEERAETGAKPSRRRTATSIGFSHGNRSWLRRRGRGSLEAARLMLICDGDRLVTHADEENPETSRKDGVARDGDEETLSSKGEEVDGAQ